mgnify:CR=1 FL=1|tara:strand:+ start:100719 stop:101858 length:1140 start_codon:yes stop_codon:yes gene_type:complete
MVIRGHGLFSETAGDKIRGMTIDTLHDSFLLPTNYVPNLLNLISGRGGSASMICVRAGVDERCTEALDGKLNWQQFSALIRESRNEIDEPALGLYLGSQLTITTHGLLGLAAMSSSTLGEAADIACQYVATRTPLVSLRMEQQGRYACLKMDELYTLGDIRATFLEALIVTLIAVLRFVSAERARLIRVDFAFDEPEYGELYQAFFPCEVRFNQVANQLVIPQEDLSLPSQLADTQVQRQATQQCEEQLLKWKSQQRLSGQIQMMLARAKGRFPSFEQVADELVLSPRTLRRRLAGEGTSYKELLDQWRQDMACQYLTTTRLSVQQISHLLGYNDPANFGRAFRRRNAGLSPLNFRRQHAEQNVSSQASATITARNGAG